MKTICRVAWGVGFAFAETIAGASAGAQRAADWPQPMRTLITHDAPVIALTHVKVIDGTGAAARNDQTVVIENGRITAVGPSSSVRAPSGAQVVDFTGHTVIPGIVGLHDHLYYTAAGGRSAQLTFSAPRLYLGSGVTTVRTTGSRAPYAEINLKAEVERNRTPGPRIHITAPYITGGNSNTTMTLLQTPEQARRFVAYWAQEGATWLKSYTDIRRAELKAAIDEAHKHGIKVTGHLCSVSFLEAVEMGIDGLEHGLYANSDYVTDKQPDVCPTSMIAAGAALKPNDPAMQKTFKAMIDKKVPMTSTLSVYELFVPNRPTKDQRTLDAMAPEVRTDYLAARAQIDGNTNNPGISLDRFKAAMAYEKAFVEAGGLMGAGVDPTGNGGALPGYGDQRNYELLSEAGFTPVEALRIMTLNGATILGEEKRLGSVTAGKLADLVVIKGDPVARPAEIRNVAIVFKDGVGYDPVKLVEACRGLVDIR